MNLHRWARIAHRWLAWAIGLQMLAWLIGGAVFAWLPFQPWVKAQDKIARPDVALPAAAAESLQRAMAMPGSAEGLRSVALVASAVGPTWKLTRPDSRVLRQRADGQPWAAPDGPAIARFAQSIYRGDGRPLGAPQRLATVPARLGIVQELAGRRDVWRVAFDDALGTRLYFDAEGGELLTARTEAWVWYDLLFRLHIMDYTGGDDFNNPLLRAAAPLALLMGLAGTAMALQSGWWRWRERRRRRLLLSRG